MDVGRRRDQCAKYGRSAENRTGLERARRHRRAPMRSHQSSSPSRRSSSACCRHTGAETLARRRAPEARDVPADEARIAASSIASADRARAPSNSIVSCGSHSTSAPACARSVVGERAMRPVERYHFAAPGVVACTCAPLPHRPRSPANRRRRCRRADGRRPPGKPGRPPDRAASVLAAGRRAGARARTVARPRVRTEARAAHSIR